MEGDCFAKHLRHLITTIVLVDAELKGCTYTFEAVISCLLVCTAHIVPIEAVTLLKQSI